MAKAKKYRFSIAGKPLYPHVKLTNERFPRVLATRLIEDDRAEYFGAFLNRTSARILLDFVNRTFRLRSCEIPIDGSFNYPCTMYYKRRCLAPCVAGLCDEDEHTETASLVRLFLRNERELLREVISQKIVAASRELAYETASKWRDVLQEIEDYWENTRIAPWVENTSDAFRTRYTDAGLDIFLVSQRSRRVLGERVFSFPQAGPDDAGDALAEVIEQFYRFHAPKEVRVPFDFPRRGELQSMLSKRAGRKVPIKLITDKNRKISTEMAVFKSTTELDLRRIAVRPTARELTYEIGRIFRVRKPPARISAIDVAHISGTDQVAAAICWESGRMVPNSVEYMLSEGSSEPGVMAELIARRYSTSTERELLLVDGGAAQINAAAASLPTGSKVILVGAVKPPGEHSEVSHFLTFDGRRSDFDPRSPAMNLLKRLRDEVHDFANAVHRETRDFAAFYETVNILPSLTESDRQLLLRHFKSHARLTNAALEEMAGIIGIERAAAAASDIGSYKAGTSKRIKPLVIPIRFQEADGAAEDLRPITSERGRPKRPGR